MKIMQDADHRAYVGNLEDHERVLVDLCAQIYKGDWGKLWGDLDARERRRPLGPKLMYVLWRDKAAVERLRAYERENGIRLIDFLGK